MDIFFLSVVVQALSGPATTPSLRVNQQVRVVGGIYEGCSAKVARKDGPEYGVYLDCDGEMRYAWIDGKSLR